jgi:hypothetical protein
MPRQIVTLESGWRDSENRAQEAAQAADPPPTSAQPKRARKGGSRRAAVRASAPGLGGFPTSVVDLATSPTKTSGVGTGRISVDDPAQFFGGMQFIMPPVDPENQWRYYNLDAQDLSVMSPMRIIRLLADLSPEISRGVWDYLRMFNPGWECYAVKVGTEEPLDQGTGVIEQTIERLRQVYGTVDVIWSRLALGGYLGGAFVGEAVFGPDERTFVDFATPDPATIRFQRRVDPVRGQIWRAGQWQFGKFVEFDGPTVRYIPIDPFPGQPYGRAPAAAALFAAMFLLGLMHDLKRVVSNQGYPRLDLSIDLQALKDSMPKNLADDFKTWKSWVDLVVREVATAYSQLTPSDAYVHTNVVTVGNQSGAAGTNAFAAFDPLIKALERMLTRALKTMPLLFASSEGTSEANANRQWELYAAGIKSIQHFAESLIEYLFGLDLQANGVQAEVRFRFAELRAAEMLRDAQTEAAQIANAIQKEFMGWITHDQAAQEVTGEPAAFPEPIYVPSTESQVAADATNPDPSTVEPGDNRSRRGQRWQRVARAGEPHRAAPIKTYRKIVSRRDHTGRPTLSIVRESLTPSGAGHLLPPIPGRVTISQADKRAAIAAFNKANPEYAGLLDAKVVESESE